MSNTNDDELLDVFDAHGNRIGTKKRSEVHRDGDWHMLAFVWAARFASAWDSAAGVGPNVAANVAAKAAPNGIRILLQLRGRSADPFHGNIDAPGGGHVGASEGPRDAAARELLEEVGVKVERTELALLGTRRLENPNEPCGRVIQYFFLCTRPLELAELRFTSEADGFVEVSLADLKKLINGEMEEIGGTARVQSSGGAMQNTAITRRHLAAYSGEILESFRVSIRAVETRMRAAAAAGVVIRDLLPEDADMLHAAFESVGWSKPRRQFTRYAEQATDGTRSAWVALDGERVAGYVTVVWSSGYAPFREAGIPEIVDFNVLPQFRRRHIGTALLDVAEGAIALRSRTAGIGVGLYPGYGAAQRMYVLRGYVPDARGAAYRGSIVTPNQAVRVDDALVLHMTKQLPEIS